MKFLFFTFLLLTSNLFSDDLSTFVEKLNEDEIYNRATSNTSLVKTKDFIANEFQKQGLSKIDDSFTHDYEATSGLSFGENKVSFGVIVPRRGIPMDRIKPSVQTWDIEKDWLPLGFSSEGNLSEKELAFVGYGISASDYDDYKGIDVNDKVVIILTDSPEGIKSEKYAEYTSYEYKVKNAKKNGAVGALFIKAMGDSANVFEPVIVDKFNSGIVALQANRASLERYFPKNQPLIDQEKAIRETKSPKSFVLPMVKTDISLQLEQKEQTFTNIYGIVEGEDEDKTIIIAFPYDEALSDKKVNDYLKKQNKFYYESGNNISGIAASLVLINRFKEKQPNVNILFVAISGDEPNFEGSKHFAEELDDKIQNATAIFYLDNTEKVHKKHLVANSNDPVIVEKLRTTEQFKNLNAEALELNANDNNPILKLNKKYVRISNKLRSYPPPKREWNEKDYEDLNEYINLLENTIRNLTQD